MDTSKAPEVQETVLGVGDSLSIQITVSPNAFSPSYINQMIAGQQFWLWALLREEPHCYVYSVSAEGPDIEASEPNPKLEARVYCLDMTIPAKVRRYRLRGIKRLESRTVDSLHLNDGLRLVVYKTDSEHQSGIEQSIKDPRGGWQLASYQKDEEGPVRVASDLEDLVSEADGKGKEVETASGTHLGKDIASPESKGAKSRVKPPKTYRHKVSARIKQRTRRQARRQEKRYAEDGDGTIHLREAGGDYISREAGEDAAKGSRTL